MFFRHLLAALIALSSWMTQSALASDQIGWDDLVDASAQSYADPYRDLSPDQMNTLLTVVVTRKDLEVENLTAEQRDKFEVKLTDASAALTADGINVDWLISQRWIVAERRERAATAGNQALDGQTVTLAGFAISGPPDDDGTPVAYLVPERGMCSHVPPPAPNQMIKVRLTGDWQPSYMHEPVRITGRLRIAPTQQVFQIVDGPVPMNATFQMDAAEIVTIQQMKDLKDPAASNDWVKGLADRLRETGQLQSRPSESNE